MNTLKDMVFFHDKLFHTVVYPNLPNGTQIIAPSIKGTTGDEGELVFPMKASIKFHHPIKRTRWLNGRLDLKSNHKYLTVSRST